MNLIVDQIPILNDPISNEDMQNAIGILKLISQGEQHIQNGKSKSQNEVFKDIENFLKEKGNEHPR